MGKVNEEEALRVRDDVRRFQHRVNTVHESMRRLADALATVLRADVHGHMVHVSVELQQMQLVKHALHQQTSSVHLIYLGSFSVVLGKRFVELGHLQLGRSLLRDEEERPVLLQRTSQFSWGRRLHVSAGWRLRAGRG